MLFMWMIKRSRLHGITICEDSVQNFGLRKWKLDAQKNFTLKIGNSAGRNANVAIKKRNYSVLKFLSPIILLSENGDSLHTMENLLSRDFPAHGNRAIPLKRAM